MSTINQEELEGVRLLSFDGGDLSAVSQLVILEEGMSRIQCDTNSPTPILPCNYFHMMGGVGTGGIIVILLTVLRMGIEEAIKEFTELWTFVFAEASLDRVGRSAKLERAVKGLLKRRGLKEDERMCREDSQNADCKAFVCAVPEANLAVCEKFRTYKSRGTSINPTIVEAIRATCATPTLFTPVGIESIGCQVTYVTGAYNFNNPARETIKEAREHFEPSRLVACILSLGCGQRMIPRLTQNNEAAVMTLAEDIASDCELVDRDLAGRLGQSNIYYRLSVDRKLDSGGDSSPNSIGNVMASTKAFLEHPNVTNKMNECTEAASRLGRVTLTDISGFVEPKAATVQGLPPLSAFFVERPGLIKKMAHCLFRGGPPAQRRMVLSGLGGIGKTQITVSFIQQFLPRFRHVLFVDGSSEQSIESGLVAKVKSLGTSYSRSSASEALEVLSSPDYEITRDWAIIYDNVDNPEINIGHYFPNCPFGTVIVTTRNPNVGILAPKAHLKLDVMSEEESIDVLLLSAIGPSRAPTELERKQSREIAEELGRLPVALVQAGYFIKIHDCMHNYRQRLKKRRPDILGRPAKYQLDAHDGLYAALNVTWPHLTAGSQHLMGILGCVNYTGFPIVLLYRAAARGFAFEPFQLMDRPASFQDTIRLLCTTFRPQEEWDEQDVDDVVAALEQYSLVTRVVTFKVTTLRLHPLVHSWAHDRLSEEEKETYRAAAVRLLVCGTGADDEDIYEFIYPQISAMFSSLDELHVNDQAGMATILAHQGDLKTAIKLWEGVKQSVQSDWNILSFLAFDGRNELRASEIDLQLARLYWASRNAEKARIASVLEQEAVKTRKRALGPDHSKTLEAIVQQVCHRTSYLYTSQGDASTILRGVLEAWEGRPDENWEAVLQAKEALALFCSQEESIHLYTEIMEARMERNGPDHHATLKAMENFAKKCRESWLEHKIGSDYATRMWISLVAARSSRRGREHPDTLDAMENLGGSYAFQNMYDESAEQWKEVVRLRKAMQGADHERTLAAITALAESYRKAGQYPAAAVQWKEVLSLTKAAHGPNHKNVLRLMKNLAETYESAKQYTEAEGQRTKILHLLKQADSPSQVQIVCALEDLASVCVKARRYTEAALQSKEIVHLAVHIHGRGDPRTLGAMSLLADIYEKTEQHDEAEMQWKEIERVAKETWANSHVDTINTIRALAMQSDEGQWYPAAVVQYQRAVHLMKEAYIPTHLQTIEVMKQLAWVYKKAKRYTEEEMQWKKIMHVMKEAQDPSHEDTLKAMEDLALFYERMKQYPEAEAQWRVILDLKKGAHGSRHETTLDTMGKLAMQLAEAYRDGGKYEKADALLEEVTETRRAVTGEIVHKYIC